MNVMNLGPTDWVTCPFNPVHRLKFSRFHNHFVKCRKEHGDDRRKQCPYNASELIDLDEYENHLSQCPYQSLYFNIGQVIPDLQEYEAPSHFSTDPVVRPAKRRNPQINVNFDSDDEFDSVSMCEKMDDERYVPEPPRYPPPARNNFPKFESRTSTSHSVAPPTTSSSSSGCTESGGEKTPQKKGFGRGAWIKRMMDEKNMRARISGVAANSSDETSPTISSNVSVSDSTDEDEQISNLIRQFKEDPFRIRKEFGRGRGAIFQTLIYD